MRRITALLFALAAGLAVSGAALGQATQSFSPTAPSIIVTATTGTGGTPVAFPSPGPSAVFVNTSTTVPAYINMGSNTVSATTTGTYEIGPGCSAAFNISGKPYVAAVTGSSATTLQVWTGSGLPTLQPNTCYLPVSFSGAFNIAQVGGTAVSVNTGAADNGSQRTVVARDVTTIAGSAPGTAGTPSANVVTIQGVATGYPVSVTFSSTPLPTGAATSALQSSIQGAVSGGTAAIDSALMGGIYNSSPLSLTTGQQSALQLTSNGSLKVDNSAVTQGVNLAQVNGVTVVTGTGVQSTGSQRVTVAQDAATVAGSSSLPAGTNVIGHVINDASNAVIGQVTTNQTAPGTTDLVTQRYTRPTTIMKTLTLATSYSSGQNIGGLVTVNGLTAGATYVLRNLHLAISGSLSTVASMTEIAFNANPSGSTFTDGVSVSVSAADISKVIKSIDVVAQNLATAYAGYSFVGDNTKFAITADGSGNIYVGLGADGTFAMATSYASLTIELDN